MQDPKSIKQKLKEEINEASWNMILDHQKNEAVIWASPELDLVEVGYCIAVDDTDTIKSWMSKDLVHKPNTEQIDLWQKTEKRFQFLILQPFVVIQEVLH
ncbi:MAG: DUF2288 family protein [Bdellovibrionaceae bacterium]|jgi:hypothetical protein|nr:DUF2288 family protein [Pseudobdellovibrionaceae bacterium]